MTSKSPLLVRDIIHNDMVFDFPLELVIDHPLFQRLKFIVQNGICYQVFPGMTHTRFQHSLGVCHIAGQWFDHLLKEDTLTFLKEIQAQDKHPSLSQGVSLEIDKTIKAYEKAKGDKKSWKNLVTIAALCHDLGHGPFSHLLEEAGFIPSENFLTNVKTFLESGAYVTSLVKFLQEKYSSAKKVDHEDITLIYLAKIFFDLKGRDSFFNKEDHFFITCSLISKDFKAFYINKMNNAYENELLVFSSITSGFIDADRLDYVVRDSKMAGVELGGVESHRIITSITPCVFAKSEHIECGFISKYKYGHIIDSFFFNLYQVYTQVLYHPKAMQLNHELTNIFHAYSKYLKKHQPKRDYLEWHSKSNDQLFIQELKEKSFDPSCLIEKVLNRSLHQGNSKSVYGIPSYIDPNILDGFKRLDTHSRDMIKDGANVWYFINAEGKYHFTDWECVSIICQKLKGHSFKPNIYWKNNDFEDQLKELFDRHFNEEKNEKREKPA